MPKTVTDLSFVGPATGPLNLWLPNRSGVFATDCATGRAAAAEIIEYMQETRTPNLLGQVVETIAKAGVFDGVEVGFFAMIAEVAIR